ncbi:hypothetical protein ASPZODRAFT_131126 [Penicilliopsis zonata CBS 506.65]|uniref:RING-type domain-containing protein n=1 Tax=Penicilliopsis zonata CBS 506.65 TaxID=1073090 RepID=A0A1L9SK53_9EURO|nr:hypothetical protein ASPZODRAFT_131126 [Penicilliopsis zonata CBS 506.65]OJJ47590.1 hypothetical protein ASPZODRAFT_131126 [Penicilliopsis zonata CBS 506.65]
MDSSNERRASPLSSTASGWYPRRCFSLLRQTIIASLRGRRSHREDQTIANNMEVCPSAATEAAPETEVITAAGTDVEITEAVPSESSVDVPLHPAQPETANDASELSDDDTPKSYEDEGPPPCYICDMRIETEPIIPCRSCKNPCCRVCVRKMFSEACTKLIAMPPKCCVTVPLAIGRLVLSPEEVASFKEKHDEWRTPNPTYCPDPICSAFIPNHYYLEQACDISDLPTPPSSVTTTPPKTPQQFSCPKCEVQICSSCKKLAHPLGNCSGPDAGDLELKKLLKQWGYKRCPKCRTAVRRMWGCAQMQCLCGAQWCWHCVGPYEICRNRPCPAEQESEAFDREINLAAWERMNPGQPYPEDQDDEEDEDTEENEDNGDQTMNQAENTDQFQNETDADPSVSTDTTPAITPEEPLVNLDILWNWEEGDEEIFGNEPGSGFQDQFHCEHWFDGSKLYLDPTLHYECEHCWKMVFPPLPKEVDGEKNDSTASTSSDTRIEQPQEETDFNLCNLCVLILCGDCRKKDEAVEKPTIDAAVRLHNAQLVEVLSDEPPNPGESEDKIAEVEEVEEGS